MPAVTAAIPVKPFDRAKQRLSEVLGPERRSALGERLARRTIDVMTAAGVDVLVLSADEVVTDWARRNGVEVLLDEGSSLDQAAAVARDHLLNQGRGWMIAHADLPLLTPRDVSRAVEIVARHGAVIAPSSDGGTSLIGATQPVRFAYGPGSFRRHLAAMKPLDPSVIVTVGWALDLDTPADLAAARRHPDGEWLEA